MQDFATRAGAADTKCWEFTEDVGTLPVLKPEEWRPSGSGRVRTPAASKGKSAADVRKRTAGPQAQGESSIDASGMCCLLI